MQITFVQKLVIKTELNTVQIAEEKKKKNKRSGVLCGWVSQ